jgi:hypothetical protein
MFKNWKTTLAGLGGIITGIALVVKGDIVGGISAVVTGVGLVAAKDSNVTGGDVKQ